MYWFNTYLELYTKQKWLNLQHKYQSPVIAAYDFASALALSKSEYPCGAQAAITGLLVFRLVIKLQS